MDIDGEKSISGTRSSEKEPASTGINGVEDHVEGSSEPPAQASIPKEDLFAWLQVLGAFFLNLTTW
jgi:hypothetical protein